MGMPHLVASSVDGHFCSRLVAAVNNAVNRGIRAYVCVPVLSFLRWVPWSGSAGSDGNSLIPFEGPPPYFPQWLPHLTSPPAMHEIPVSPSPCSHCCFPFFK